MVGREGAFVTLHVLHGAGLLLAEHLSSPEAMNLHFFCPCCGKVWGKVLRGGELHYVLTRWCEEAGSHWRVGGSFFQDYQWQVEELGWFLLRYPSLLRWEFEVHMRWAERFLLPTGVKDE